ncbi:hypothetical protein [Halomonas huangheensis]|uniref:Diaminopimelate decarboxylase n=1 Tax=Halomonas huangheensis TaxID=1178482 RepID=W1N9Z2_9GAMM|nr:hypothetical protein [Halomonas huangheensis]ALM53720.1 hypothetical protein AR456_16640 [Halomonas huangheensis]ERL52367.1 hypothetical protein BJB45_10395 [Halomonas huangheensis]
MNKLYSWHDTNALLDEHGGVAYVFHSQNFLKNVESLRTAFKRNYRNFGIGLSYKTNYLPKLCSIADRLGLYAEVVSGMEYQLAKAIGVDGRNIIFNGPGKSLEEIQQAFSDGALVNVDSLSEAILINGIAHDMPGITKRVGLRCNLDLQWKGRESRFGLSETSGELERAVAVLRDAPNVFVEGLHCHTSFDRSAESYARRMQRLIELADTIFPDAPPKFLDIGGGIFGPVPEDLASQFAIRPPTYDDYAQAICAPLKAHYGDDGPELIIEPGVGLLANVLDYLFRVDHVKQVGSRWFAVTTGAAHQIKIVPNEVNPSTVVYPSTISNHETMISDSNVDLVGFTCLEHDVIYRGFSSALKRGDVLVSRNVGAYSMVISSDFIRTTPPVLEYMGGEWQVLREKVTVDKLLNLYRW